MKDKGHLRECHQHDDANALLFLTSSIVWLDGLAMQSLTSVKNVEDKQQSRVKSIAACRSNRQVLARAHWRERGSRLFAVSHAQIDTIHRVYPTTNHNLIG